MNKRANLFLLMLAVVLFGPGSSQAVVLNVPQIYQEQDQWCWAASSKSVLDYFGINLTQSQIAQYGSGGQNIPNYLAASDATENGVNAILNHFAGIGSTGIVGPIAQNALATDIDVYGAPAVILWDWDSGGGHILVVHGLVNGTAYLMDPWNGPTINTYNWVMRGGTHTWKISLGLNSSPPTRQLTVASSNPAIGVQITASPQDNSGYTFGLTPFLLTYYNRAIVRLNAPAVSGGNTFQKWLLDGNDLSVANPTQVTVDANHAVTAVYATPATAINLTCNLSANSVAPGAPFGVSGTATYNENGGPVQAGTVTISVGGQMWTAAINNGAFTRAVDSPAAAGSYTVSCSADDGVEHTGACTSTITVQNNGTTAGYNISGFLTCQNVDATTPYAYSGKKDAFGSLENKVFTWIELTNVYGAHTVDVKLYRPDGTFYDESSINVPDSQTQGSPYWLWYRLFPSWPIAGSQIQDTPGTWTVRLYVDGDYKESISFVLGYRFVQHVMSEDVQATDPYNPINPKKIFDQANAKATTWASILKVSNPLTLKWIFYEPNGSQYATTTYNVPDPQASGHQYWNYYDTWSWINVAGSAVADKCGEWSVDVFVADSNGQFQKQYSDYFSIMESPLVLPAGDVARNPSDPIETQGIRLNLTATDNTYLKSATLYWNDGTLQSKAWDNINSNSFSQAVNIGGYPAGKQVDYWVVATDTSGNTYEGVHHAAVVQSETVSSPQAPSGTNAASWRQVVQFSTGGSTTTLGEVVEYQFDWGDGQQSSYGSAFQSHSWEAGGTFAIRARARSQVRPGRVSDWSGVAILTVAAPILPQLGIRFVNGQIELSWPTNPAGFTLQSTKNLATNPIWSTVSTGPSVVGPRFVITTSPAGLSTFYRLTNQ